MFSRLNRSVGVAGLIGIDRILSFQIVRNLQMLTKFYSKEMPATLRDQFVAIEGILNPTTNTAGRVPKCYDGLRKKTVTKHLEQVVDFILEVGQAQLLRKQISNELNFSCQLDSKLLCCALKNMNTGILKDIRAHYRDQETMPYPKDNNPLLGELSKYVPGAVVAGGGGGGGGSFPFVGEVRSRSWVLPGVVSFIHSCADSTRDSHQVPRMCRALGPAHEDLHHVGPASRFCHLPFLVFADLFGAARVQQGVRHARAAR